MNAGEDVLVFYNDRASFQTLVQMMRSERDRMDENSPLMYHIHLVELLAVCTEGKNVYTEIKCNSLLPLDDIVRVVTHEDCIPEVRLAGELGCLCLKCAGSGDTAESGLARGWVQVGRELGTLSPSLLLLVTPPANPDSQLKSFYTSSIPCKWECDAVLGYFIGFLRQRCLWMCC